MTCCEDYRVLQFAAQWIDSACKDSQQVDPAIKYPLPDVVSRDIMENAMNRALIQHAGLSEQKIGNKGASLERKNRMKAIFELNGVFAHDRGKLKTEPKNPTTGEYLPVKVYIRSWIPKGKGQRAKATAAPVFVTLVAPVDDALAACSDLKKGVKRKAAPTEEPAVRRFSSVPNECLPRWSREWAAAAYASLVIM